MSRAQGAAATRSPGRRCATCSAHFLVAASVLLASAAGAQDARPAVAGLVPAAGERLPTHFPFPTAPRAELTRPPSALHGQCEAVHRDMRADLAALVGRARANPEVGRAIVALSCFRSPDRQARLFSRAGRANAALPPGYQVAPPGHSEHATGLAIDFGDRRHGCDLVACFANTPVGRWLAANAAEFGFEMSFPEGNSQGVAFEPWHWRWVGRDDDDRSLRARSVFAAAHKRFPVAGPPAPARVELADSTAAAGVVAAPVIITPASTSQAQPGK